MAEAHGGAWTFPTGPWTITQSGSIAVNGVAASLVRTATAAESLCKCRLTSRASWRSRLHDASFITGQIVVADGGSTRR